jgi:hypothetical protein
MKRVVENGYVIGLTQKTKRKIQWDVNENGCFICTSHRKDKLGYPRYYWNGKQGKMSRYIYEECFGEIPEGMLICHKCDTPQCINPEHFFLGTLLDNMHDMVNKGRKVGLKGEKSPTAKLTLSQVLNILKDSRTQKSIALSYGISQTQVWRIKRGERWHDACSSF